MFKAILSYDGTRYFGWQKTMTGPSIQEELEKAVFQISGEQVQPEAASRTDRGVHAEGQVIQFSLEKEFEPKKLQRGLNAILPSDIRVVHMDLCHFHPTLDAIGKEYHYRICTSPVQDPTKRLYSWHFPLLLDQAAIELAAKDLAGTHDFSAFANEKEENPLCTLESISYQEYFIIRGDRFLYKMVRNIVGTLVYIGCGKLPVDAIPSILKSLDRKKGGVTAPAHGLYLHQVFYTQKT